VAQMPIPTYEQLKRKVQKLEKEALRRKQADEVLRKSEERYRMIFNYSPLGIVHFDSIGMTLDCNECFLEIMGAPKEKLIGFNMVESLRDEKMRSAAIAGLSGKPNYFEGDYRSVNGNKVTPLRAMFSRITSEDGTFSGAVGLFEDITERKKSEEALRESQEFLGKIVNSINDPIFVKDRQHRLILVNDAECALAGLERKDLIGRTDYDFFPKEQVDIFWQKDEIVFETGEENENEEEITDALGRTRTIVTKKTLYTDKAEDKFIVGVIRDITERKEAELALQAAHQGLQDILEFLPDATFIVDPEKKVIYWNRAMEELSGLKKQDILGQTDYAYAIPFYGERRPLLIDHVMGENPEIEKSYDYIQRKGTTLYGEAFVAGAYRGKGAYLWATAAPLLGRDGNIIGIVQSMRDISDRKRAEQELRQIPSKLISVQEEERKRLASELHDSIGQTLAAVKFWVEMALKLRDENDCNAVLTHLEKFVPILQRSIQETRSIYMGLRPSMLDNEGLLATLEWLRGECMKLYPERHIKLDAGIAEEEVPESLKVNIFRIVQEALNNIAKHSKADRVDVSLSKIGSGIELVVSDDGAGMDLKLILQTSTARSLGLTSMRERAELTGGSFSIESTLGEGTTIRAFWPIEAEDQPQKGGITSKPAVSNR